MLFCEKDSTWRKKPHFAFFWCFSWFRALVLKEARKAWWEVLKKQLQGSRKPAQDTKGEVEAFDCDKSANLMPTAGLSVPYTQRAQPIEGLSQCYG